MVAEEANERNAQRPDDDLTTVESILVAVRVQVAHPKSDRLRFR
jgi:hypothetical protein